MSTLESFQKQYDTTTTDVTIRDRGFRFFVARALDSYIDHEDIFHAFPLWTKIWEASIVLADYLAGLNVEPEKRFLELGCGLGLVGIVATSFGHKVIMTDYNKDALNFANANAVLNNVSGLEIKALDWNRPRLHGTYDYIIGSEIIYKESDFRPILNLFMRYAKDDGEIILAERIRKTSMEFFNRMGEMFHITAQKKVLRSHEREIVVMLCRMRLKQ